MKQVIFTLSAFSVLFAQPSPTHTSSDASSVNTRLLNTYIDSVSYTLGLDIGHSLSDFRGEVSLDLVVKGLTDQFSDSAGSFDIENSRDIIQKFSRQIREKKLEALRQQGEKNRVEGELFLEKNSRKKGVITTKSGLQYLVLKNAKGMKPKLSSEIRVNFTGSFIDGTVFDATKPDLPIELQVSDALDGWKELLQLMSVGSRFKAFLPAKLAYGDKGSLPDIAPHTVLIFEIELVYIVE